MFNYITLRIHCIALHYRIAYNRIVLLRPGSKAMYSSDRFGKRLSNRPYCYQVSCHTCRLSTWPYIGTHAGIVYETQVLPRMFNY